MAGVLCDRLTWWRDSSATAADDDDDVADRYWVMTAFG